MAERPAGCLQPAQDTRKRWQAKKAALRGKAKAPASNAPFSGGKGSLREGGVRVPAFRSLARASSVSRGERSCAHGGCSHADALVLSASEKGSPRRRTKGGPVELVVTQSACGYAVERWSWDWPAKRPRRAKASVVGHDQKHVWCALGSRHVFGEIRLGFARFTPNTP